nr:hypothetical protein [Tanacetum cinerariifolium]
MVRSKWMYEIGHSEEAYVKCVPSFLQIVEANRVKNGDLEIWCPCKDCKIFDKFSDIGVIANHLITRGFVLNYTRWSRHGELQVNSRKRVRVSNENDNNDSYNNNDLYDNIDSYNSNGSNINESFKKLEQMFRNMEEGRKRDRKLRHLAYPPQWRKIDNRFDKFGAEIRNIRFGLSSDGINPFENMSSNHSTWPVLLCVYNLPPWLCMKRKYIMMSLLIQGLKQPGNDIDVYLAPLIDDMKTLWGSSAKVYDAYRKEKFQLRAMIFCTISDFPAYDNLSGYSTKGKLACPVCEDQTSLRWLPNCRKTVTMSEPNCNLQPDLLVVF